MENKITGKITGSVGGLYTVRLDGGEIIGCRARGVFRHEKISPLVGDEVAVLAEKKDAGTVYVIDEILPRKNSLIRPALANLDILFVTLAAARPEPSLLTIDKMTSICEFNGIEPVIIIGKCELDPVRAEEIASVYRLAGYDVFVLSCFENVGIEPVSRYLAERLPGKTAAFAGVSGAGKSTLINRLFPGLNLTTGEVSRKTERGRHTTRAVSLYEVGGGFLADTPGFSMLDFERFDFFSKEDLPDTFREFGDCIGKCRYKKCTHTKEDGCAVLEKMRAGGIAASRHESFLALYDILKQKHDWDK